MSDEESERRLAAAVRWLGSPPDDLQRHSKELTDANATYFWQPVRGGGALIVGEDGVLFASSAVPPDEHRRAWGEGIRTDPSLLPSDG